MGWEYQNPCLVRVQKKPLQFLKQRLHYFGKGDILNEKTLRFRYHFFCFVCLFMPYSIIFFSKFRYTRNCSNCISLYFLTSECLNLLWLFTKMTLSIVSCSSYCLYMLYVLLGKAAIIGAAHLSSLLQIILNSHIRFKLSLYIFMENIGIFCSSKLLLSSNFFFIIIFLFSNWENYFSLKQLYSISYFLC